MLLSAENFHRLTGIDIGGCKHVYGARNPWQLGFKFEDHLVLSVDELPSDSTLVCTSPLHTLVVW
jgi:hypothetical protein